MLTQDELKRYERHLSLPGFGKEKQELLKAASVLVVGAGGLGCPVLQYLAAAGVGKIGIVDDDVISISNLQRQVLYSTTEIGKPKAHIAEQKIAALNPTIQLFTFNVRVSPKNVFDILSGFDVVADCTDNFATRYLLNDACVIANKTLVSGSVFRFEGQVIILNADLGNQKRSPDYRALFPDADKANGTLDCNTAGVLGVLPGIIGCLQATEIIKYITNTGTNSPGELLLFCANDMQLRKMTVPVTNKTIKRPGNADELGNWNYSSPVCSTARTISVDELMTRIETAKNILILDVRMPMEFPEAEGFSSINIPLPVLKERLGELEGHDEIVVFCQSGQRSAKAVEILSSNWPERNFKSLVGGIENWNRFYENAFSTGRLVQ